MIDLAPAYGVDHALRLGYLKPGDQLPKVWDVVASLAINPNTVLKAYRELETNGLAVGRPGQALQQRLSIAQVRAGDSRRPRGRPGRSARRRQDHLDMVLCLPTVALR